MKYKKKLRNFFNFQEKVDLLELVIDIDKKRPIKIPLPAPAVKTKTASSPPSKKVGTNVSV